MRPLLSEAIDSICQKQKRLHHKAKGADCTRQAGGRIAILWPAMVMRTARCERNKVNAGDPSSQPNTNRIRLFGTCHSVGRGASLVHDRDRQNLGVTISDRVAEWFCVHKRSVHVQHAVPSFFDPTSTPRNCSSLVPASFEIAFSSPRESMLRHTESLCRNTELPARD